MFITRYRKWVKNVRLPCRYFLKPGSHKLCYVCLMSSSHYQRIWRNEGKIKMTDRFVVDWQKLAAHSDQILISCENKKKRFHQSNLSKIWRKCDDVIMTAMFADFVSWFKSHLLKIMRTTVYVVLRFFKGSVMLFHCWLFLSNK